jgi:hypothetical protein
MSDIVKRLRVPPDLMTDFGRVGLFGEAAVEIERLRARVEVLELIRRYMGQGVSWDRAEEKAIDEIEERKARAALEAKP